MIRQGDRHFHIDLFMPCSAHSVHTLASCDDGKAFLMLVKDCFLTQHVSEPTRGDNILDLILSTQKERIDNVRVIEPLGKSDHSQIQFNLRVNTVNKGTKQKTRDFQKGDYEAICAK